MVPLDGAGRDEHLDALVALQILLGLAVVPGRQDEAIFIEPQPAQIVAPVADDVGTVRPFRDDGQYCVVPLERGGLGIFAGFCFSFLRGRRPGGAPGGAPPVGGNGLAGLSS